MDKAACVPLEPCMWKVLGSVVLKLPPFPSRVLSHCRRAAPRHARPVMIPTEASDIGDSHAAEEDSLGSFSFGQGGSPAFIGGSGCTELSRASALHALPIATRMRCFLQTCSWNSSSTPML